MNVINLDKLNLENIIVMTGRAEHIREVAKTLDASLYYAPRDDDYFMDYPLVVKELQEVLSHRNNVTIVTTQSEEFLDALITSDMDFTLATVRKFDTDEADTYRLRVTSKEEAWKDRRDFHMELRV